MKFKLDENLPTELVELFRDQGHDTIVFRLGSQSKDHLLGVAARLLQVLEAQELRGQLWIVEDAQIRVRE